MPLTPRVRYFICYLGYQITDTIMQNRHAKSEREEEIEESRGYDYNYCYLVHTALSGLSILFPRTTKGKCSPS